jgi:muramoyltetrapeptide carboxypeptidase
VEAICGLGLKAEVFGSARGTAGAYEYLAADDSLRAADLTTALADPGYAAVFFGCGGYGAQRTLELVDWDAIDPSVPKAVVGFSDVTAVLEAIAVKLGWVSFFGPMPACSGFVDDLSVLARVLFSPSRVRELVFPEFRTIVPGVAEGVTLGGTATLLATSIGTDTSLPAAGAILLLEDVDEPLYRLDRTITQLRRAAYFDGVAGILLGAFTDCGDPFLVEGLLTERLADLGVPILAGADIGHVAAAQTFPIGVRARLDTIQGVLRFTEPLLLLGGTA